MAATSTTSRRAPKRIRRARNARKNTKWPVLTLRTTPEQAEAIRAAGGLGVVLQAVLGGAVVPAAAAERRAEEASEAAAERVEAQAVEDLAALRESLFEWELYATALEARLRAAEARLPQVQAQQHRSSYEAGYAAGVAAGREEEATRRARLVGVADASQARQLAAAELATMAKDTGWHLNWSALAREALRRDCLSEVGRAVPREYRRRYDAAAIGLAMRARSG